MNNKTSAASVSLSFRHSIMIKKKKIANNQVWKFDGKCRYLLSDLVAQGDPLDPKCEQDQDFIYFELSRMRIIGTTFGT